jgi:MFS family permease
VSAIGFAVSLFSLPTAIGAMIAGGLIDWIGFRRALGFGLTLFSAGLVLAYSATSIALFDGALLIVGIGYLGLAVSCPAILMSVLSGGLRVRAMSLLSTCPPTGYALGLLIAGPMAAGPNWRIALLSQAVVMLALIPCILLLPAHRKPVDRHAQSGPRLEVMSLLLTESRIFYLAVACALPGFISYGTSLVSPSYIASVHHVSLSTSSVTVAIVKVLVALISSLAIGQLLARNKGARKSALYVAMAAIGLTAQFLFFFPSSGLWVAVVALFVWLVAFSGMAGTAMASLPDVVSSPARAGLASGIVSQVIALVSFIAPTIYFWSNSWLMFFGLAVVCLSLACLGIVASLGGREITKPKIADQPV